MMVTYEKNTWPLWQCLSPETLALLVNLQRRLYDTELTIPTDPYKGVENLQEIDQLIRQSPQYPEVQW